MSRARGPEQPSAHPSVPSFSCELFPPRSRGAARRVVSTVRDVAPYEARFFSVTCGASGSSDAGTEATVRWLQEVTDAPLAAHMTCIGASREALMEQARRYWQMGVRHIVALRGDPPRGEGEFRPPADGYTSAAELVEALRGIAPFDISVAGYPETHPDAPSPRAELEYLKRKVDAGADRVITQVCFDNTQFLRFRDRAWSVGIEVPIVAGILPIVDFNKVARFCRSCGATVPDWLARRFENLDRDGDEIARRGAATAAAQCLDLRAEGVDAFHFYTMNRPEPTRTVIRILGLQGAAESDASRRIPVPAGSALEARQ